MDDHMFYDIGDFARQILSMQSKVRSLTAENERLAGYEKKYNDLMSDSLSHSRAMIGNTVKMLLVPGIAEAFQKNAKAESFVGEEVPKYDELISSKELIINTGRDDEPTLSVEEKEMYTDVHLGQEVNKNPDIIL